MAGFPGIGKLAPGIELTGEDFGSVEKDTVAFSSKIDGIAARLVLPVAEVEHTRLQRRLEAWAGPAATGCLFP